MTGESIPNENTADLIASIEIWCTQAGLPLVSFVSEDGHTGNGICIWQYESVTCYFARALYPEEKTLLGLLVREWKKTMAGQETVRELIHEVGNALSVLDGQLQFLKGSPSDARWASIDRALEHMTYLLRESGNMFAATAREECEVRAMIDSVVHDLLPFIREKDVHVKVEGNSDRMNWYPGYLRQILINLIKNAIEAAPLGGAISLSHNVGVSGIDIAVKNADVVISPDTTALLFTPHFSSSGQSHRGFGLSLSRKLAERGCAHLDYDAERGFVLSIPLSAN